MSGWPEPFPTPQSRPDPSSPSHPWRLLLGSDLEKVSRSSRFLEKATDRQWVGHSGAQCLDSALSWAPGGGMSLKSHLPPPLLHPVESWGWGGVVRVVSTPDSIGNIGSRVIIHASTLSSRAQDRGLAPELCPPGAQILLDPHDPSLEPAG